jgi:hypothetical protein
MRGCWNQLCEFGGFLTARCLRTRMPSCGPGKQADFVLIKGDPSKRIDEIENVETVFKAGIGYDSKKLIDSVRGQVGIG